MLLDPAKFPAYMAPPSGTTTRIRLLSRPEEFNYGELEGRHPGSALLFYHFKVDAGPGFKAT